MCLSAGQANFQPHARQIMHPDGAMASAISAAG
jgi:hypothetical protein